MDVRELNLMDWIYIHARTQVTLEWIMLCASEEVATSSFEFRVAPVSGLVSWSQSQASMAARSYTCQWMLGRRRSVSTANFSEA